MPERSHPQLGSAQQGAVLMEAMIAILIFSVGILGIVGMQASMIKNTAESKYRADAAYIAQQRLGLLWANPDPLTLPADGSTTTTSAPELPGGTVTVTRGGLLFTITVNWHQPGEPAHNFTTIASIAGG